MNLSESYVEGTVLVKLSSLLERVGGKRPFARLEQCVRVCLVGLLGRLDAAVCETDLHNLGSAMRQPLNHEHLSDPREVSVFGDETLALSELLHSEALRHLIQLGVDRGHLRPVRLVGVVEDDVVENI